VSRVTPDTKMHFTTRPSGHPVANYVIGYSVLNFTQSIPYLFRTQCSDAAYLFMASLNLVSYNLHGFNQGVHFLSDLYKQFDIIFVQEHWLNQDQLTKLDCLSTDFICFSKSAMDNVCKSNVLIGRPFGGTATFIHSKYSQHVKFVAAESNFLIVLCCGILLINVYLPCSTNAHEYCNTLLD
jgi:hypothetical protein